MQQVPATRHSLLAQVQANSTAAYTYPLPPKRIALHPAAEREQARMLVYREGVIKDATFEELPLQLPAGTLLVLNDTRVVPARLRFTRSTGGVIEVFCLEPIPPGTDPALALQTQGAVQWHCMVGNLRRWPQGEVLTKEQEGITLHAQRIYSLRQGHAVNLQWQPSQLSFAQVLEILGTVPLPPYLQREALPRDTHDYQTVYAAQPGAVAAPTAGLHLTPALLQALTATGVVLGSLTLHVGAGTFKPLAKGKLTDHVMHAELLQVPLPLLQQLQAHPPGAVAVGTTSLRALESLYWLGLQVIQAPHTHTLQLSQWAAYEGEADVPAKEALAALIHWAERRGLDQISASTALIIAPGYRPKLTQGLITNFHQPGSSLLVLVAALIGPAWQQVYAHALANGYQFLSYGDGSLLWFPRG